VTHSGLLLYARSRTLPRTVTALVAAAASGASLHSASAELDRTAVRPWWRRRLVHLLALTALAAALLPWAVLGHTSSFGPPAMIRNTLGCVGLTAAAAVPLGARLSWLPVFGYVSAVYVGAAGLHTSAVPVWAWLMQPAGQRDGWLVALAAFTVGCALYLVRGARAEEARD
jgi:hypothetical protein